jgi:hypothetical protein
MITNMDDDLRPLLLGPEAVGQDIIMSTLVMSTTDLESMARDGMDPNSAAVHRRWVCTRDTSNSALSG